MPKKILIADDSVTIRKIVEMTFQGEDFTVTSVDNGSSAIRKAREIMPDVILADAVMPGIDGYELSQTIKKEPQLKDIPVLLLTGTFNGYDEIRGREAEIDDYIIKPFESQILINKVKALCEKKEKKRKKRITAPSIETKPGISIPLSSPEEKAKPDSEKEIFPHIKTISPAQVPPPKEKEEIKPEVLPEAPEEIPKIEGETLAELAQFMEKEEPSQTSFEDISVETPELKEEVKEDKKIPKIPEVEREKPSWEPIPEIPPPPLKTPRFEKIKLPKKVKEQEPKPPVLEVDQKFIKETSQKIIEQIVWEIVPELAETIIREEIQRLLKKPE